MGNNSPFCYSLFFDSFAYKPWINALPITHPICIQCMATYITGNIITEGKYVCQWFALVPEGKPLNGKEQPSHMACMLQGAGCHAGYICTLLQWRYILTNAKMMQNKPILACQAYNQVTSKWPCLNDKLASLTTLCLHISLNVLLWM